MAYRVMLVEDNEDHVFLFRHLLEGCREVEAVEVHADAESALERLRKRHSLPHFILLDLKLPRMSGQEFLAALRAEPALAHLPVFALTSSDRQQDRQECRELGARGYFIKPLREEHLREIFLHLHPGGEG